MNAAAGFSRGRCRVAAVSEVVLEGYFEAVGNPLKRFDVYLDAVIDPLQQLEANSDAVPDRLKRFEACLDGVKMPLNRFDQHFNAVANPLQRFEANLDAVFDPLQPFEGNFDAVGNPLERLQGNSEAVKPASNHLLPVLNEQFTTRSANWTPSCITNTRASRPATAGCSPAKRQPSRNGGTLRSGRRNRRLPPRRHRRKNRGTI